MAKIGINDLTFGWEGKAENVFEGISFVLDTDWRIGLIGRNGRGKTTLLRLLAEPDAMPHSGDIISPVGFRYFPYDIDDTSRSTMDIVGEVCPAHEFWELRREMNLLGVPGDALFRQYDTLSPGERTKTLLASLFLSGNDFVLLDEPTNHLDEEGKRSVAEYLKMKKGFLVVSHDRALLDSVCDHVLSIGKSGVEVMNGNYSVWADEKMRRDHSNIAGKERLEKDIRRMKAAAQRTAGWSDKVEKSKYGNGPVDRGYIGHKSAKLMKRSKAIEKRRQDSIDGMQGLLNDIETSGSLKIAPLSHHADTLVEIRDLRIEYLPAKSIHLLVRKGERISLAGGNGAGKSSVAKVIAGEPVPYTGTVKTAAGLIVSYVPQETAGLSGSIRGFVQENGLDLTRFFSVLTNFGFPRGAFDTDLSLLSDGQKRKALLAKSLCESAHLYLWDEPLNFIDVISREQIEAVILEYAPTMIFVEHDAVFTSRIATRTVSVGGAVTGYAP
ncbi:MAG: ATP-binding cassette domain-containing protein [Clostridiales Family XIII bacterium]|jgi:lincosamide and streptogramin A transport system ATP-binding/permease protein|nr:ATP-binding cassette domain-containing protein [Clostridiales Family XIII bacterium]